MMIRLPWKTIPVWLLVAFFTVDGIGNTFNSPEIVQDYSRWGHSGRSYYLAGILELMTAGMLALGRTRFCGAALGSTVMAVAAGSALVHGEYSHSIAPVVLLCVLVLVGWRTYQAQLAERSEQHKRRQSSRRGMWRLLDTQERFGLISIVMHWTVAVAIVLLLGIGLFELAKDPRGPDYTFYANLHVSIAMVALPVIALRIAWRIKFGKPVAPRQTPILMTIAGLVWRSLLVLMGLQYLSGPAMVWIHEHPLDVFGIVKIHAPAPEFWKSIAWAYEPMQSAHEYVGWLLLGALALHVGGALKHLVIDRDGTVERMIFPAPINHEEVIGRDEGDDINVR